MSRIAVIGAGAWGTALCIALGRAGRHELRLWAYEREVLESVQRRRTNDLFLPGFILPESIVITNSLPAALERAQIVLAVMPSHHARRLYNEMQSSLPSDVMIVSATKGIENQSYKRMTEVATEASGVDRIAALSGPSFAKEVARGDPSALTAKATSRSSSARSTRL